MPHWEATEDEQREHVRICFELAARYDADVDMHVDETDDGSVRTLAMVVEETERRGWQGRVTVGHVCALSAADDEYADQVVAGCARLGVTVVSNPVTNLVLQGRGDRGLVRRGTTRVRELLAAGCRRRVRAGLRAGRLLSVRARRHAGGGADLGARRAPHDRPRAAAGAGRGDHRAGRGLAPRAAYGVAAEARADLQLYAAASWPEVLRLQDPPRQVWFRGRTVARTTVTRELLR